MAATTDQFEVVRSTTIGAPAATVHGLLRDFHEWTKWSPWEGIDPNLERTYSGPDSGVGATYAWRGNRKVGQGRMEILEEIPNERVVIALEFIKPFKASNTAIFELESSGESTMVIWRMIGPRTFMTKVMGIFTSMDKMIGPDFEKGLAQLSITATS
jgi:hypothetical protein